MSLPFPLQDHETVLLRCRRHAIYLYPRLVAIALVAIAPVVVLLLVTTHVAALAASAVWLLFWVANAYLLWFRYRNDMWIVTNQRVVDSVKRHWFHHRMASTDLVDVEDIAIHRAGVLQTVLNFGNVQLQTAGVQANFVLTGIPDPAGVLGTIDAARDQARNAIGSAATT